MCKNFKCLRRWWSMPAQKDKKKVSNKGGATLWPQVNAFQWQTGRTPSAQSLNAPMDNWTTAGLVLRLLALFCLWGLCMRFQQLNNCLKKIQYIPLVFNVTLPLALLLPYPASMKQALVALPSNSQLWHSLTEKKYQTKGGPPYGPKWMLFNDKLAEPPLRNHLTPPWTTGQLALSFGFLSSFSFGVLLCHSKCHVVHSVTQQLLKHISRWFSMSLCLCRCCFLIRLRWRRLWWLCLPTANCDTVWTRKKVSNKGGAALWPQLNAIT